jgi:hypothetical protein
MKDHRDPRGKPGPMGQSTDTTTSAVSGPEPSQLPPATAAYDLGAIV